jgi:hypothetical protein
VEAVGKMSDGLSRPSVRHAEGSVKGLNFTNWIHANRN